MKTALVTGANKSIGYETVKQLSAKGIYVFLGSRNMDKGIAAVRRLEEEGFDNIEAIQIDARDPASIAAARVQIEAHGALDILVNNAGVSGDMPQHASDASLENIRSTFETNLFGTINVIQEFLPLLKKSDAPCIVNLTSGLSSLTLHNDPEWVHYPFKTAAYGPSKTALNAYTVALAHELKDTAFKINAVDPGFTATDFNHHTGTGTVTEAAEFVVRYALVDADGPTGKFFSKESTADNNESPW